jgi:hypothetical protein
LSGRGPASFDFAQSVLNGADASVCCRATVNVACVDAERMRPTRIPKPILHALSGVLSGTATAAGTANEAGTELHPGTQQPETLDGI